MLPSKAGAPQRNKNAGGKRVDRDRVAVNMSISGKNGLLELFAAYLDERGKPATDDEIKWLASQWAYAHWKQRLSPAYQEIEAQLATAQKEIESQQVSMEIEAAQQSRLVGDWNALCHMLDKVLGTKVYSKEHITHPDGSYTLLWTIEYDGKVSTGHTTVADAYQVVFNEFSESARISLKKG